MLPLTTFFLILTISSTRAQSSGDRAPHGLAYQNPTISISPSAYDFFHPNDNAAAHQPAAAQTADTDHLCGSASSECSRFPLSSTAAQVRATQVHQPTLPGSSAKTTSSSSVGPGGIAGIVLGLAFALLLAMGAYYVVLTRRSNSDRAKSAALPDV